MFPEHAERSFLDPEYSFDEYFQLEPTSFTEYFQLGSRTGIRPVKNGINALSPFLTGRMFVRPNILRTLRRTMIRFLIEHLVRRIWFGQSRLYFILNWLVMRCKLRPELAADAQQTA